MTIKGKYVQGEADWTVAGKAHAFSKAQITEMDDRMDKSLKLFQAAWPDPKGMVAKWGRKLGYNTPGKSGTIGYSMEAMVFHYYCNPDLQHLGVEDETNAGFGVQFNVYSGLLFFDSSMHVGHYNVALMAPRVGKLKDVDLYQTSLVRAHQQFVVIARDGQFPLVMLSRGQYLASLKARLQREEARMIAGGKSLQYWQSHYDPPIKVIDDYVSHASEDDLAQTAFVKDLQHFTRFYTEKEGGCAPVISNKDYFRPEQTPYFPQFMIVIWAWNDGEGPGGGISKPVAPDLNVCCGVDKFYKESMEQNLDVAAFRAMLDK